MTEKITAADQARYTALAERMERGDFGPIDTAPGDGTEPDLDALLADITVDQSRPTPPLPSETETVDSDEVRSTLGRPRLDRSPGTGRSPKRQVRLPHDLDQLLDQRAALEHRTASEIMRDAIGQYLHAS